MPVKNTETLKRRLLLLSNSSTPAQAYLGHASEIIKDFLGARLSKALFIPFAAVIPSFEDYTTKVRQAFREMGFDVTSIHEAASYKEAILRAEAIIVGGGNTFYLLRRLREQGLLEVIQSCVADGVPYIGWSAGSNIVCPTIKTTNDMPIVDPENLNALNLIPFQINPHFLDFYPSDFPGGDESRADHGIHRSKPRRVCSRVERRQYATC